MALDNKISWLPPERPAKLSQLLSGKILESLVSTCCYETFLQIHRNSYNPLWLKLPIGKSAERSDSNQERSWEIWNVLRLLPSRVSWTERSGIQGFQWILFMKVLYTWPWLWEEISGILSQGTVCQSQCCFCYNSWPKWLFKNVMQKALRS